MTAVQRSNVLTRQEKAIGSITLPRLLLAGGAAIMVFFITNPKFGQIPGCTGSALICITILTLTQPVQGMALYKYAYRTLRGWATLAAINRQEGVAALTAQVMQTRSQDGILRAEDEYAVVEGITDEQDIAQDWAYLGDFRDAAGHGLAIIDDPFAS